MQGIDGFEEGGRKAGNREMNRERNRAGHQPNQQIDRTIIDGWPPGRSAALYPG